MYLITGISQRIGGPLRSVQGFVTGLNEVGAETWLMTLNHSDEPWVGGGGRMIGYLGKRKVEVYGQ